MSNDQNIENQLKTGLKWRMIGQVASQVTQILTQFLLIYFLSPKEFGLMGQALVFIGFANFFVELGLASSIIREKEVHQTQLSSIFWLTNLIGLSFAFLLFVISKQLALLYTQDQSQIDLLTQMMMVSSLNYIITSSSMVPINLLKRKLQFDKVTKIDTFAILISCLLAILGAYLGFGVWALILQNLSRNLIILVLSYRYHPWLPDFRFSYASIQSNLNYGWHLLGFNLANYSSTNIDQFLIGKYIGANALGIYSKAYELMLIPLKQISTVISSVMFPILSKIQDDHAQARILYLKGISYIATITFPLMLTLMIFSREFVLCFFGEKWIDLIDLLHIFCPLGMLISVGTTVGWLYLSQGKSKLMFQWELGAGFLKIISILIGLNWGMKGIAIAYTTLMFLLNPASFWLSGSLIALPLISFYQRLAPILFFAILSASLVFLLKTYLLIPYFSALLEILMIGVASSALIYIFILWLFKPFFYQDFILLIKPSSKGNTPHAKGNSSLH